MSTETPDPRRRVTRILIAESEALFCDLLAEAGLEPKRDPRSLYARWKMLIERSADVIAEMLPLDEATMRARWRERLAPTMREVVDEMKASASALDMIAMRIGRHVWGWIDEHRLFARLEPGAVPDDVLVKPERSDVALVDVVTRERAKGPALQVKRDVDPPTIGGIPVDARALRVAEGKSTRGPVTWSAWRGHFVARLPNRDPVAIWRMPEGYGLEAMQMVLWDGSAWGVSQNFAMRLPKMPEEPGFDAKIRESTMANPHIVAGLVETIGQLKQGTVVTLAKSPDGSVTVGSSVVPIDQVEMIEAGCGPDLEWLWIGERMPIGARKGGRVVAMIMPMLPLPAEPVVSAPGGSS